MNPLLERLKLLDGWINEVVSKLKELYGQLDRDGDSRNQGWLQGRIFKLKTQKRELDARCEVLENKLQPAGYAIQRHKSSILVFSQL